jgi:hypothetical protein
VQMLQVVDLGGVQHSRYPDKQCGARLRSEGPRAARCEEAGVCQRQCVMDI